MTIIVICYVAVDGIAFVATFYKSYFSLILSQLFLRLRVSFLSTLPTSEQALYRLLRLFCCCIYTAAISIETRRFPLKAPGLLSAPKLTSPPIPRAGGSLCLAPVPPKVRSRRAYRTARMQSLCRFASWSTATSVKPTSVRKTESCALSKIRRPSMVESHFSSLGLIPSDSFAIRNVPPGFKTR